MGAREESGKMSARFVKEIVGGKVTVRGFASEIERLGYAAENPCEVIDAESARGICGDRKIELWEKLVQGTLGYPAATNA